MGIKEAPSNENNRHQASLLNLVPPVTRRVQPARQARQRSRPIHGSLDKSPRSAGAFVMHEVIVLRRATCSSLDYLREGSRDFCFLYHVHAFAEQFLDQGMFRDRSTRQRVICALKEALDVGVAKG